jgi:hypothetical protein
VEDNGADAAGTGWVERALLEGVRKDDSSGYELAIPVEVESWESRPEGNDWQEEGAVWCYWGELEEVS